MSGITLFGLGVGWAAQFILDRGGQTTEWTIAIIAGLGGSFVGGFLFSPIAGDGGRRGRREGRSLRAPSLIDDDER